jgi:hypothetical protein
MTLDEIKKLVNKPEGSAGRRRALKWIASINRDAWFNQNIARYKDLFAIAGRVIPASNGRNEQDDDRNKPQYVIKFIGRVRQLPRGMPVSLLPEFIPGQPVQPDTIEKAFSVPKMPGDFNPTTR